MRFMVTLTMINHGT